jgi:hypothetical protein
LEGKTRASTGVIMEMLSHRYGWTPLEILEQPPEFIERYIEIISEENKIKKYLDMKNKK